MAHLSLIVQVSGGQPLAPAETYRRVTCLPCVSQAQQAWSRELHGWTVEELRAYVIWAKANGQNLTMSTAAEQASPWRLDLLRGCGDCRDADMAAGA